ncbi:MAG: 1-deoxy-D-xylulose-5-phosphate synthase [Myxococcales bacterium]|nr:1-deoxy-D-xylulose-5-phosphate synthase [Myxococcales bacterium]
MVGIFGLASLEDINMAYTNEDLENLRNRIIEISSKNGGHLAPSLGVVELSTALHEVFKSPEDSIIWDVGHQAYAHKILTGRGDRFHTIRMRGGLSGFPKREESEHDPFGTGHSSTSISAALGIAEAKRLSGDKSKTIAVIGDGSLTGGLAFEGMNNAGHIQNKNLIVVLNDNQMSIDKNVGAIARFMNRGLTNPTYNRIKRDVKTLLNIVSTKELNLVDLTRRAALVVKDFFLAGSLFEAFGFRYIGPIDGHDYKSLVETLKNISDDIDKSPDKSQPVLLHVITKKGKGYAPAEKDPSKYHGISKFDINTGDPLSDPNDPRPTYTAAFSDSLCRLMQQDSRVIAITAAMPSGTGLDKVRDRFPGRYYDVGIAEQHATVFAAGLATRGFRPVFAVYSSFLQRSFDQVIHDVALQNLPVIFAIDRAGVVGDDGPTHHGVFDLSFLRSIPNMTIMAPSDEEELSRMLFSAMTYKGPVAIRYPRGKGTGVAVSASPEPIPFGKSVTIGDPEKPDCVIFSAGNMLKVAVDAASSLKLRGIDAAVVDARFVKPLDESCILRMAKRCRRFITIEDGMKAGGFGSAVLELLSDRGFEEISVLRFGYDDIFVEQGAIPELHRMHDLYADAIVSAVISENAERSSDSVLHISSPRR